MVQKLLANSPLLITLSTIFSPSGFKDHQIEDEAMAVGRRNQNRRGRLRLGWKKIQRPFIYYTLIVSHLATILNIIVGITIVAATVSK